MKLYVNITLPRREPVFFMDIDLEKEICRMYLRERCPICNGRGCTTACREAYPTAIPADQDGYVLIPITAENIRTVLGAEALEMVKGMLSDGLLT